MKYIDLNTTPSGDIFFENTINNNSLKISFNISESDIISQPLKISFYHTNNAIPPYTNSCLKLNLDYSPEKNKYKASCVVDDDVTKKLISYAIRTTVSDLKYNSDFGSDIELYMHKNIRDRNMIATIESSILKSLTNILSSPRVIVKPVVKLSSNGYHQGIDIKVFNNGEYVTDYSI